MVDSPGWSTSFSHIVQKLHTTTRTAQHHIWRYHMPSLCKIGSLHWSVPLGIWKTEMPQWRKWWHHLSLLRRNITEHDRAMLSIVDCSQPWLWQMVSVLREIIVRVMFGHSHSSWHHCLLCKRGTICQSFDETWCARCHDCDISCRHVSQLWQTLSLANPYIYIYIFWWHYL